MEKGQGYNDMIGCTTSSLSQHLMQQVLQPHFIPIVLFLVICCFCCLGSPGVESYVFMFYCTISWTSCELDNSILPVDFWVMFD